MTRPASFRRDCGLAGVFYLGLGITGISGFLLIRPALYVPGDPAATLANLMARPGLASAGVALELAIATFQALAALWFARIFRDTDSFAAGALGLFGLVNAVMVLASAAFLGAAVEVTHAPGIVDSATSYLFILVSSHFWKVATVFFGLWLFPMGWLVWRSKIGPRALGWVLIVGCIGYVVNAFIAALAPTAGAWVGVLSIPATIGEFWMIGLMFWLARQRPDLA